MAQRMLPHSWKLLMVVFLPRERERKTMQENVKNTTLRLSSIRRSSHVSREAEE